MGWSSASTRRMLKVSQSAVSRILFPPTRLAALLRDDDHSSSPVITDGIKQPTRKPQTGRLLPILRWTRSPIWPCSVRGFACHPCCHERGALLPHLFTLTLRLAVRLRVPLA